MAKKLSLLSTHPCAYLKLHCDTSTRVLPLWEHTIRTSCKRRLVDKFVFTNYQCSSDIRKRQESRLQTVLETHIGWEWDQISAAQTCAHICIVTTKLNWADWKAYQQITDQKTNLYRAAGYATRKIRLESCRSDTIELDSNCSCTQLVRKVYESRHLAFYGPYLYSYSSCVQRLSTDVYCIFKGEDLLLRSESLRITGKGK